MDILEQHLDQQDVSSVNPKVEVGTALVLEETDMVECEAYDPLAGDNQVSDDGIRYPETVSYRVVQVNSNSVTNDIDLPVTHQSGNSVQVLTAPGQYFIVSNPNEIFTTTPSSRSLAPRATTLQIDTPRSMTPSVKKRDDRRRATHNEVERRRRDKINNWIAKLGKIIPECSNTTSSNGNGNSSGEGKVNYETQSKGGILAKACDYINDLKDTNQKLNQCLLENAKLQDEVSSLKEIVAKLTQENNNLKLTSANIIIDS